MSDEENRSETPPVSDKDKLTKLAEVVESRGGANALIDQVSVITNRTEAFAVDRIDELINRLQNLKQRIILENKAAVERAADFINLVDTGMKDAKSLDGSVDRLERLVSRR